MARVSMEKENNKRDQWLTQDEEQRLLLQCAPWLCAMVIFALHTGMRMGEIILGGASIWAVEPLIIFRSKNGERRTIPVNDTVLQILKEKTKVLSGVELYKVQRLLGHKSPMMTQRYAHHYPESLRDGVEVLDKIQPVSHFITAGSVDRECRR